MKTLTTFGLLLATVAAPATAQEAASDSIPELRTEIGQRYDAAVAMTLRRDVIASDDSRFLWSSEAKVQCGIAIGYLKNGIADAETIARCRAFADRMNGAPGPGPQLADIGPIPTPPQPEQGCTGKLPVAVFFDWASAEPVPASAPTISQVVASAQACGWTRLNLVGRTDRSGDDAFNLDLSRQRAETVAAELVAAGFARDALTTTALGEARPEIATADGVREPMNRRVDIDLAR